MEISINQSKNDWNIFGFVRVREKLEKKSDFWKKLGFSYSEYCVLEYGLKNYHIGETRKNFSKNVFQTFLKLWILSQTLMVEAIKFGFIKERIFMFGS